MAKENRSGGHCHCGAVEYEVTGEPIYSALCNCEDCRRAAGAPIVSWTAFPREAYKVVKGELTLYRSSPDAERYFCARCGTGIAYVNEVVLPGLVDIQTTTLDDPEAIPPVLHVQAAEELSWMKTAHELPKFDRYPTEDEGRDVVRPA